MVKDVMTPSDMTSPYRGLTSYNEADAPYFFGRTAEIATIAANLEVTRLTIFYGPSGVGKTSVLRAGVLFQLLQRAQANFTANGCPEIIPIYFNHWQHDALASLTQSVVAAVQSFLPNTAVPLDVAQFSGDSTDEGATPHTSFTAAIRSWTEQTSSDLLLILDQFEEYFLYHTGETGPGTFAYELAQAVNSPGLRVNFLLSLREDALARLDYFKGQIPFLLDNRLSMAHLRRAEGREAVTRPLDQYNANHGTNYTIELALVEAVLDQVARGKVTLTGQGASITAAEVEAGRIEVPYLQLVLTRLWTDEGAHGSTVLRQQTLNDLGGAEKIVSNYLDDTMAGLSTSYQAIAARFFDRLVTLSGTKIALSLGELTRYAKADPATVQEVLQQLQAKRLLRGVQSPTGTTQYELFHDVLAQAILDWQSRVPWRTAEHYLDSGLFDWREGKQGKKIELLLDQDRYQYIWTYKKIFGALSEEANEFLARTALYHGDASFSYWFNCLAGGGRERLEVITTNYVLHQNQDRRKAAQQAIIQAQRHHSLDDKALQQLADIFLQQFQSATNQGDAAATGIDVREATATLLWTLRKFISTPNRLKVASVAFKVWVRNHRTSPIFVSVASSFLIAFIIWIAWQVNQNLRGSWQPESLLLAGPLSAVAWVKSDPNVVYVVTPTGPEVGSGATLGLYERKNGMWQAIQKSSLTNANVTTIAVVESDYKSYMARYLGVAPWELAKSDDKRLYISIKGIGISRSDDNGQHWQSINSGLYSYDIVSLIQDEYNPEVLYAGSADSKGVFESRNGGDTWQGISGDELFGTSISVMAYTKYDGGALIVGTSDERILMQKKGDPAWKTVWSFAENGPITAIWPEQIKGETVYAGTARGNIFISDNGGKDWGETSKLPGTFSIISVMPVPGADKQAFVSTFGYGGYRIWKTEDKGVSWEEIKDNDLTREAVALYIHQQEPDTLYAYGTPGFFEIHNDENSWTSPNLKAPIAPIHRVAISPVKGGPTYVAVGGAIFSSPDPAFESWQRGYGVTALTVRDIVADPDDKAKAYAAVYLPNKWSVLITENSGMTWTQTISPTTISEPLLNDTMALAIAKDAGTTILYAGTNGCGVINSIDGEKSWDTFGRQDCNLSDSTPKNVIDLVVDPNSSNTLYVAADRTLIYVGEDRGKKWSKYYPPINYEIGAIEADKDHVYLIAGADGFWRSDDGGQNWDSHSTGLEGMLLNNLVVIANSPGTLYVSASNGGIWKTIDWGVHWVSAKENLTRSDISDLAYDPQSQELVLSSGQAGLYRFKSGSLWGIRKER